MSEVDARPLPEVLDSLDSYIEFAENRRIFSDAGFYKELKCHIAALQQQLDVEKVVVQESNEIIGDLQQQLEASEAARGELVEALETVWNVCDRWEGDDSVEKLLAQHSQDGGEI